MARIFYTQKTECIITKIHLLHPHDLINEELKQKYRDLSNNCKMCALGDCSKIEVHNLNNIKDITSETIKLGCDFLIVMQERDNQKAIELITKIEQLLTIWRNKR